MAATSTGTAEPTGGESAPWRGRIGATMTRCPACGTDNPPDFRFCGGCGAPLTGQGCAACGFPNPPGQRFCGRCGAPQEASEPAIAERPTAERKLATILFADVVGFTSIAEQTDPEALARTVDAAFRRLGEIVVEHGGTVDKYMGDCLMAVFGVPTAHDDDAERAVAAALAMTGLDAELEFSIGINSGEVMVGAVGRDDSLTVMGDTVNVAARLEKTAGPGEVLLGPMTAELVADRVVLREREAAVLKGKRDPVPMWEAVALRPSTLAAECPPPLIGRDDELAFLRACWRRTVRGSRLQLILLTGPAGVGKTRLIDELASAVAPEALVVRTTCPGYGSLVRSRVGADLARQLGVTKEQPPPGAAPSAEPAPAAEGEEHNVWRMRRLIAERAAERPLLVAVDDLHHAQPSDLDPVTQLLARLGDVPVMVTLVGRPEPGAWLGRFPDATALHLDPLVFADAATLAAALAGDLRLASDSAERLAAQSGGNPLHLRELVRLLHSRGGLVAEDGQYRLDEHPLLPPSLHAVLGARLDALAPADKGTLQDVSVFSGGATITDVAALGTSDAEATLERLVTAGLLRQRDGGRYDVADPLLREVAYEALPRSARGDRHRRAAAVAATSQGRARHLGFAVDYLSDDTELRGEAALALALAGRELIDSLRLREGTGLLARAVELGHEDVEDLLALARALVEIGHCEAALGVLQRLEGRTTSERMAVEALHLRGNALRPTDPERSIAVLLEAAERWQALGDEAKRAWALTNQGMTLFDIGRIAAAAAAHEEALGIFRRLGDRSGAAAAGQLLALARLDDPRVPSWIDDGLHLAHREPDAVVYDRGYDDRVIVDDRRSYRPLARRRRFF